MDRSPLRLLGSGRIWIFLTVLTVTSSTNTCELNDARIGEDCSNARCTDENSACVKNGGNQNCACASKYIWTGTSCVLGLTKVTSATETDLEFMVDPVSYATIDLDLLTSSTTWETEVRVYPEDGLLVSQLNTTSYYFPLQTPLTGLQIVLLGVTAKSDQFQVQQILTVRLRPPVQPLVLNILLLHGTTQGSVLADLGRSVREGEAYRVETHDETVNSLFVVSSDGRVECGRKISLHGITNNKTVAHEYNFNVSLVRSGEVEQIAQMNVLVFRDLVLSTVRENWKGVIIRYYLSPNDNFLLSPVNVPPFAKVSSFSRSVILNDGVDYESFNEKIIRFEFELKTMDSSQMTSIAVELTIIDENDSNPKLVTNINNEPPILDYYLFEVLAGSPGGTVVGVVSSQDADTVGSVSYSLEGEHKDNFTVDSMGIVRTTVPLRKAMFGSQIELFVTANDGAQSSDSVLAVVFLTTLNKVDMNLNMLFEGSVVEESDAGQLVTNVSVDQYTNYNFTNFLALAMFSIDASTGEVQTRRKLDRERDRTPTDFSVQAALNTEDQCQLVILGQLVVTITDVNDMSPRFAQTQYSASMTEESPSGLSIQGLIDVEAFDDDGGQNALLSFSLSGPDSQYFDVESSGNRNRFTIKTSSTPVDLESLPSSGLTFTLTASDNPMDTSTQRSSSITVVINVDDMNDLTPTFTEPSVSLPVLEGLSATTVTTLTATDGDRTNNDVSYSLVLGDFGLFQINKITGELRTTQTLDREKVPQFVLIIHAIDTGRPRNTGSTTVTVDVEDVNDNNPMFTGTYRLTVAEENCPSTSLLQVEASDADTGTNAQISYSTSDSYFTVSEEGQLRCSQPLDYEAIQSHIITIVATDKGSPSLNASVTVEVEVTDINDNAPVFISSSYSAVMTTGEWFGDKPILVVQVTDKDSGSLGETQQLSLTNHADVFVISGSNTGVIRVSRNATKPTSAVTYTFKVTAVDGDGAEGEVNVIIQVLIDNTQLVRLRPPVQPLVLNILLLHGTTQGSVLADLGRSVREGDAYRVETHDETVNALFVVSSGGRVECGRKISLDGITNSKTVAHEYNFNVSLVRPGEVKQITQMNVLVFRDLFLSTVRENWKGVIIRYYISPNDNFLLSPVNVPPFANVSTFSRSVSLNDGVDYDSQNEKIIRFEFKLKTMDSSQMTSIAVELTIIDENDSKPKLVTNINNESPILDYYLFEVLAGSPGGTVVGVVSSQDADTVGSVIYSLEGDHKDNFKVDSMGIVRTTVPLRKAMFGSKIDLFVTSNDGAQSSDSVRVVVFLTTLNKVDRNLNMLFEGSVVEESEAGQLVTNVSVDQYTNYNFTNFLALNMFSIDASTGEVRTRRKLNRERDRTPTDFSVQAALNTEDQCQLVILGQLVVTITDVNDMSPRFAQTHYIASLTEESPSGLSIQDLIDVEAFDDDEGQNALLSFALSGPDSQYFDVESSGNRNRFTIKTSSTPVDLESLPSNSLTFTLTASDNPMDTSTQRSSSITVVINVDDVNDLTPTFTEPSVSLPVLEGLSATTVTTLTATDGDRTNNDVSYSIVLGDSGLFQINTSTGELRTTQTLDRENVAQFVLIIHAIDTGRPRNTGSTTVTVDVEDVNDNNPMFTGTYRLTVAEENCPSTALLQVEASDADAGTNAQISYSTSDSYFTVSEEGQLRCSQPLDYEAIQSHLITIVATDKGSPSLNASVTVEVEVTDINDNAPVFNSSSYSSVLTTGEWFGDKPILVVQVTDMDSGLLGEIQLSLTNHADVFVISGSNTGVIRVSQGAIKPTSDVTYTFKVTAVDGDGVEGEVTVTIQVLKGVTSTVQFNQYGFNLTMEEETDYSSRVIGIVSLYQPSVDVEYSIISDGDFLIDKTSGEVTCRRTLDRESSTHRVFIVKAKESALSEGNSEDLTVVNVTITDKNDNSPIFTRPARFYLFDISEDAGMNQAVATVEATDVDEGDNSRLEYSIASQTPGIGFQIDSTNGRISVSQQLDRERIHDYSLVVKVSDMGSPALSESTTVTIGVLDVNDVTPHFEQDVIEHGLQENQLVGVSVLTVSAKDEDYGDNATIMYRVQPSSSCPLAVSNKGEITLASALDYEASSNHLCVVYAMDRAASCPSGCTSQRTGSTTVTLSVDDVNDNPPQFIDPPYHANISRNAAINDIVTDDVKADDVDSLYGNGLVKYFIISDQNYFQIDRDSGKITVATSLENIESDNFRLTLEARDTPISDLQKTAQTTVNISIISDKARPFFNKTFSVTVTEHLGPRDQVLVTTQAFLARPEGPVPCDVTNNCEYSIDGSTYYNPDAFVISAETGELRLNNTVLDRDAGGGFIFITVRVVDKTTGEFRTTRVTVNIIDINDNMPYFENLTATFTVAHSVGVDTIFATLASTDKDQNSNPVFSLNGLYDTDDLKIGVKSNGSLYVKESLLSWNGTITFDVNVKDGEPMEVSSDTASTRPQQQRIIVEVRGDSFNEHAPVFTQGEYEGTVYALARKGAAVEVEDLRAVDEDNDTITYSIQQGNIRETIGINTITAELFLRYNLDGSIPSTTNLTVIAVDVASPPRTGTCLVVITLTDQAPTQCIRQSELDSLSLNSSQRTLFLSLFIAVCVLLTAVLIYAIIATYKWRSSVSLGSRYRGNVKNANTEKRENTRYDGLEGRRDTRGYDGLQRDPQDFSAGMQNPGYVSAGTTSSGSARSPPGLPFRGEPVPDYDDDHIHP